MSAPRVVRGGLVALALAVPPVALAAFVWPGGGAADEPGVAPERDLPEGAFEEPVVEEHRAEIPVGDEVLTVTMRPDPGGVCVDLFIGSSGSGQCGDLASLAQPPPGFGGSGAGERSTIHVLGLTWAETESMVVTLADGTELPGVVADIPGRPERVYALLVDFPFDAFSRRGGSGATLTLLDAAGDALYEGPI